MPSSPVPTLSDLQRLDNEQALDLYWRVSSDIARRIENYVRGPDVTEVVLEGLKFTGRAERIHGDLRSGTGLEAGEGTWECRLFHAPGVLTRKLSVSILAAEWCDDDG